MAEVLRMPRMSDTMEEGVIVGWLKKVGESIEPGDVLAEVETDKATMELEAFQEGVLLHIAIKEGPVPVEGILAVIGEKGEDYKPALEAAAQQAAPAQPQQAVEEATAPTSPQEPVSATAVSAPVSQGLIKASPLAKSMAAKEGLDLANISGTGDEGRIVKRDIESALASGGFTAKKGSSPKSISIPSGIESSEEIPVSQMRKTIARRLSESKFTSPHFYLTMEINMDTVISARKQINEVAEERISFNDIIVKVAAASLEKHPEVNASWYGDKMLRHEHINIGVAVAVADGLVVPVINNTNLKSLSAINYEVKTLAEKARNKKLKPDEMQGNTFTISNLGMFGIDEFTAIINPPDACILAVGGIAQKPIVVDGEIKIGNVMKVTLSCDHRIVDGAMGAKFLKTFKSLLESPIRILI